MGHFKSIQRRRDHTEFIGEGQVIIFTICKSRIKWKTKKVTTLSEQFTKCTRIIENNRRNRGQIDTTNSHVIDDPSH